MNTYSGFFEGAQKTEEDRIFLYSFREESFFFENVPQSALQDRVALTSLNCNRFRPRRTIANFFGDN